MSKIEINQLIANPSCVHDYDPEAMSVAQARYFIQQFLIPVESVETIAIQNSLHRVLSSPVISSINVPGQDNSAMDGFAFRHAEAGAPLRVVGTAFAGRPYSEPIPPAGCIKIMTGAIVPADADTVVMQEHTHLENNLMQITRTPVIGANIRRIGEDVALGQTVLATGHRIQPADMGLLASLGIGQIQVFRRLSVAFFSTGDELVSVGQPLQAGQIYDSNRYSLRGMLQSMDVAFEDLGNVADDPVALEQTLFSAASRHDVVITSGGVSVGEADFMKALLAKHGQILFWKINMKPGRPLAYGKIGNAHYFGLPGNPVSAMVTFYQFVQHALRRLSGEANFTNPLFDVECVSHIKKPAGRTEFQRGVLFENGGQWQVKTTGGQGSAMLSSMSQANCFIVLEATDTEITPGMRVKIQPFFGALSL